MKTPDQILKEHEDANEMHFHQVDREWIINAMEEYAESRKTWTKLTQNTMPTPMEEVFLALADGNYAVGWLTKSPTPTFVNIHNEAWWVSEVSAWMYPKPPKP